MNNANMNNADCALPQNALLSCCSLCACCYGAAAATLNHLICITEATMAKPADHSRLLLAGPLCFGWVLATQLAYPTSKTTTTTSSSSSSSSRRAWTEEPRLRRALPAVAALLHWQLQQPQEVNPLKMHNVMLVASLTQQVQLLVESAAAAALAAAGASQPHTSSNLGLQQQPLPWDKKQAKQSTSAQMQQDKGQEGVPAGPVHRQAWELYLPQTATEQVSGATVYWRWWQPGV
jgi:hypothetical protein